MEHTLSETFQGIADAIRAKGIEGKMTPLQMADKIASIVSIGEHISGNIELQTNQQTNVSKYETATVKSGSASVPDTSIQKNPTITVSNGGLVTASFSKSQDVTPVVSSGWVDVGNPGSISISGQSTLQLNTKQETNITPNDSQQTAISANEFAVGNIVVNPVPTESRTIVENGTVYPTNGKYINKVVVNVPTHPMYIYRTGTGLPSSNLGEDGDVYFDLS